MINDEVSCQEIDDLWKHVLKQRMALACFRENSRELVGVNMTLVTLKDEKDDYGATVSNDIEILKIYFRSMFF